MLQLQLCSCQPWYACRVCDHCTESVRKLCEPCLDSLSSHWLQVKQRDPASTYFWVSLAWPHWRPPLLCLLESGLVPTGIGGLNHPMPTAFLPMRGQKDAVYNRKAFWEGGLMVGISLLKDNHKLCMTQNTVFIAKHLFNSEACKYEKTLPEKIWWVVIFKKV